MNDPYDVAVDLLGYPGRMLSGSKTADAELQVVWNANVLAGRTKIWYGDISITRSADSLQDLADILNETIYVLREMDARFDTENDPRLDAAVAVYNPESN